MRNTRQIIVIMTDTQRKDMVGCYGHTAMQTPQLDRLAAEGMRFERAYTCQPVCGPARAAMFTGTRPHKNNGWANSMAPDFRTRHLGQRARALGLETGYVGKWHLDGGDYFGEGVCPDGWDADYWYDMKNYLDELSPEERTASRQEKTIYEGDGIDGSFTFGHRVANRAVDFINSKAEEEFLLVVSFDEPHGPYLAPQRFIDMHQDTQLPLRDNLQDDLSDKPFAHRVWSESATGSQAGTRANPKSPAFFGCNSFIDEQIGRVIDAIDEKCPDALVIYTSDHGDFMNSHGLTNKGAAMYEEITNIPFIARWPGVIEPGSVSQQLVSLIDVVPTVLAAAGAEALSPVLDGCSLCPAFENSERAVNDAVFMEFGRYEIDHDGFGGFQPIRCVRDSRYKLVINLLDTDELYDLEADPYEMKNCIAEPAHQAVRDRLHDRLLQWMNESRDPFRGWHWRNREWRKDAPAPTWSVDGYTRQRVPDDGESLQLDYDTGLAMKEATRRK